MRRLVDVSGWQSLKGADYARAKALGLSGVICKLSQGERASRKGVAHARKALAADVPVGAYHFADPLKLGLRSWRPIQQADAFCDAVDSAGLLEHPWPFDEDRIPRLWLDMEWKSFGRSKEGKARGSRFRRQFRPSNVMEWSRLFVGQVQAWLGVTCGIYTGRSYVRYRYARNPELAVYPLWLAAYVSVEDGLPGVDQWPRPVELTDGSEWVVDLWQCSGRGSVPWYRGGKGKIDLDLAREV